MPGPADRLQYMKQLLAQFIKENPGITPTESDDPLEIADFIIANAPAGTRSIWLKKLLEPELAGRRFAGIGLGAIGLIAAGLVIAAVFIYGIFFESSFLSSIGDPGQARGLITFLFAFGTIAVILIISICAFWAHIDEVEQRVGLAKDILTILIGIFGTIIGFYFGSAGTSGNGTPPATPPAQQTPAQQ